MKEALEAAVNKCLERINQGESIESCLSSYPEIREELSSLLSTTASVSELSKIQPSEESTNRIKAVLMARIRDEENTPRKIRIAPVIWFPNTFRRLRRTVLQPSWARIAAITLILALLSSALYWANPFSTQIQASAILSILSGIPEVRESSSGTFGQAADDMRLYAGYAVRTSYNCHALITFSDASIVELEPDTEIEIQKLPEAKGGSDSILLKQLSGQTWNCVQETSGSTYRIETPTASILVQGAMLSTLVNGDGSTNVNVLKGTTSVFGNGKEARLIDNSQTTVAAGGYPALPQPAPDPKSQIVVTVNRPAVGSVTAPSGASTGSLPDGTTFHQIPGAQCDQTGGETQVIMIREPASGRYEVTLRYVDDGDPEFSIVGLFGGDIVYDYQTRLKAVKNSAQIIRFGSGVDENGRLIVQVLDQIEKLEGQGPEKLPKLQSSDISRKPENAVYAAQIAEKWDVIEESPQNNAKNNTADNASASREEAPRSIENPVNKGGNSSDGPEMMGNRTAMQRIIASIVIAVSKYGR